MFSFGSSKNTISDNKDLALIFRTTNLNVLLFVVFITALSLIFLESVLFHALMFVASHIEATMAIPIALLGISIGGIIIYLLKTRVAVTLNVINGLTVLFVLSFPLVFFFVFYFSSRIFNVSYLLLVPFIFGSMILSIFFVYAPSARVYFADLIGAGVGAVLAALTLEYVGSESAFFLGGALLSLSGAVFGIVISKKFSFSTVIFLLLLLGSVSVMVYHERTNNLNFVTLARVQSDGSSANLVYKHLKLSKGKRKLIYSHSSIAGRIDALGTYGPKGKKLRRCMLFHNAVPSDSIKFRRVKGYSLDPRVPWGFIKDPDSLIIGTSAEGIVNTVAGMGNGKIYGVELCPGKVDFMVNGPGKQYSYDAYQHLDEFKLIDARSYLNIKKDLVVDHITLMNAHLGPRLKRSTAPEYLHTVDAFVSYFEHLSDRGFVNVEETSNLDLPDDDVNIKLTSTIVEALKRYGVKKPSDHIYVFKWGNYMQFFVKAKPFTDKELQWLDRWLEKQVKNRRANPFVTLTSIVAHPKKEILGPIASMIRTEGKYTRKGRNYEPATDDKPFIFDVYSDRPIVKQAIWIVFVIAGLAVIIPALLIVFVSLRLKPSQGLSMFFYFGLLGIAYLLIEIVLIQWYEMYLGSPVLSVITVIGGMLVFSGLGSYFSQRLATTQKRINGIFLLIVIFSLCLTFGGPILFEIFASIPIVTRSVISIAMIAPLAFFMGMPFPVGLTISKQRSDARAGALMFSVNGAFSAIASPLAFLLSMNYGFKITLLIGTAIYVVLILFLNIFNRK